MEALNKLGYFYCSLKPTQTFINISKVVGRVWTRIPLHVLRNLDTALKHSVYKIESRKAQFHFVQITCILVVVKVANWHKSHTSPLSNLQTSPEQLILLNYHIRTFLRNMWGIFLFRDKPFLVPVSPVDGQRMVLPWTLAKINWWVGNLPNKLCIKQFMEPSHYFLGYMLHKPVLKVIVWWIHTHTHTLEKYNTDGNAFCRLTIYCHLKRSRWSSLVQMNR